MGSLLTSHFATATWMSQLSARLPWVVLGGGVLALSIALIVLMLSSWGQARPLAKCVALSVWAHVVLLSYAYLMRMFDELIHYAKGTGVIKRPHIRRQFAELAVEIETLRMLVYETAWKTEKDGFAVYEPSRDKALADTVNEKMGILGTEILGDYSLVDPLHRDSKWSRLNGVLNNFYWGMPALAIAGGTKEIQKNVVGQFGLKLPKSY